TADIGLVSFPRRSRELVSIPWREEPMVLVCSPAHPLAESKSVKPAQLDGERYIAFDKGLIIRREVDRFLREHGAHVDVAMEFDNIENIKKAIEVSGGVALLPEPRLQREVKAGTLVAVPLAGCRLVRPLGIIYDRRHRLNTTILRLIDLLRDEEHPFPFMHAEGNGQANGATRSARPRARRSPKTPRRPTGRSCDVPAGDSRQGGPLRPLVRARRLRRRLRRRSARPQKPRHDQQGGRDPQQSRAPRRLRLREKHRRRRGHPDANAASLPRARGR